MYLSNVENKYILTKKPSYSSIEKGFCSVLAIILLVGGANIFFRFLSLIDSIIILVMFFALTLYVDYKVCIATLEQSKKENQKQLLQYKLLIFFLGYICLGLLAWILLSFLNHWTVFLLPLYHGIIYPSVLVDESIESTKIPYVNVIVKIFVISFNMLFKIVFYK